MAVALLSLIIALLAIAIGATILSGLLTIYIDVPRQMRTQFRNYGANMILTPVEERIQPEDVAAAVAQIPEEEIVGVAPYRYETVRINGIELNISKDYYESFDYKD